MTEFARFTWTVVIPVKVLARAKSRLAPFAGDRRGELALAFASDTVAAVLACPAVSHALVVTDDPVAARELSALGASVISDSPGDGLNAALVHGARVAGARWPGTGIAALSADLPALRPAELARALREAEAWPSAFVPDAQGTGTTMYTSTPGTPFQPMFGGPSRARHALSGVVELGLHGVPGLRRDVDTADDLRDAIALGAGTRTAALAADMLDPSPG
jgi:2-phospho-L-lactate/phosphoenolpyruvate guanylyltransferase